MIKYCIFDLDGTLLNTITTITYYVNRLFAREGLRPISEDECKIFVGDGAYHLIKRAASSRGVTDEGEVRRLLSEYNSDYHSSPLYLTHPYDGVMQMLAELSARGIGCSVLSNKPEVAVSSVVSHFFPEAFDIVRGGRDGVPLKPFPDALLSMLCELGVAPLECIFVGDSSVDILTAKNAGLASVGCLWGFRDRAELVGAGADHIISSPTELLGVLE